MGEYRLAMGTCRKPLLQPSPYGQHGYSRVTWRIEGMTKEGRMAETRKKVHDDGADRLIESLAGAEKSALEAVRKFLDTVDDAFPHVGEGSGWRVNRSSIRHSR